MSNPYLWLKAAHIISVIAWMAGMLYLPRLFVYHAGVAPDSDQARTFKIMEDRLYGIIMTPAILGTWAFGTMLVIQGGWLKASWFHTKFFLVILLSALHGIMGKWIRQFAAGTNTRSAKFYRIFNEVITVTMIAIVVLAVVKPF